VSTKNYIFNRHTQWLEKYSTDTLKILIVSTPKTGNTWLKYLLSAIYDLPMKDISFDFEIAHLNSFGSRWIGHQHYEIEESILSWSKETKAVLITTIRHPGDMLVSLYNYIKDVPAFQDLPFVPDLVPSRDFNETNNKKIDLQFSEAGRNFLLHELNISLEWIRSGITRAVRYEDLWRDPVETLAKLTANISEVPLDTIERAVEFCDISLVRKQRGADTNLIRKGGIGGWVESLPQDVIDMFRFDERFKSITAELGYNFDPQDPLLINPIKSRTYYNPFRSITQFNNGVVIAPIIVRLYLTIPSNQSERWLPLEESPAPASFFSWLNTPTDSDTNLSIEQPQVLISNLAAYIYQIRSDVQAAFPDLYGLHRTDFAKWFIRWASTEYQLDNAFIQPVYQSYIAWANAASPDDPAKEEALPLITNGAAAIYKQRSDVQEVFPDLYGQDRIGFIQWFIERAPVEHQLEKTLVTPVEESLKVWSEKSASKNY
jgi:hypothetical protein